MCRYWWGDFDRNIPTKALLTGTGVLGYNNVMTSDTAQTEVGSYFISNYPPFSQWTEGALEDVRLALHSPPHDVPLGLYLHIPFCRKRCKFCYFKVFTDNKASDIERYVAGLSHEIEFVSRLPVMGDRPFRFVYFGGGTPSFLSPRQLTSLVERLQANICWDDAEEVTFECEPGTLSEAKLRTLKQLGVTRLSLGVENFSDEILSENGRAHLSPEIDRAWRWIEAIDFPNVNIDLISGMVGETWDNWRNCVQRTLEMSPQSVTIYQMELPFNTVYSRDILDHQTASPVADWNTKRAWVDYAFEEFVSAGYSISSAYTVVKNTDKILFSYRDNLWQGSDLLATGIASFGHVSGVHYQNLPEWEGYLSSLEAGNLPLGRGMRPSPHQLLVREMILQMKRGYLDCSHFEAKFDVDILDCWDAIWQQYARDGFLHIADRRIELSRAGLLRVDALLPAFFEPKHRGVRYT